MVSWVDGRSKGLEDEGVEEGGKIKPRGGGKEEGKERKSGGEVMK